MNLANLVVMQRVIDMEADQAPFYSSLPWSCKSRPAFSKHLHGVTLDVRRESLWASQSTVLHRSIIEDPLGRHFHYAGAAHNVY